jgi:nicotinamidase-related amidase
MEKTALLIVDVQKALIDGQPYNKEILIENIKRLALSFRENNIEVVYVRHDGGTGDELEYGTEGWQIYDEIAPKAGERIFDKRYNSSFRETHLKEYLDEKNIQTLILVGLQTEYCIDTTCKVAFEYGYKFIIPEETTSTYEGNVMTAKQIYDHYVHEIWDGRFAQVMSVDEIKSKLI